MTDKQTKLSLEEELAKQMEEIDRRIDRSGWFYLIILVLILFAIIYLYTNFSRHYTGNNQAYTNNTELLERIESLESQVESMHKDLDALEERLP